MTTYTWNGSVGQYANPANWSPNGVPGAGDTAVITAGNVTTPANNFTFVGGETILLSGASTLTYAGTPFDIQGSNTAILAADAASAATAKLIVSGVLNLDGGTLKVSVPTQTTTGGSIGLGVGTLEFAAPVAAGTVVSVNGATTPLDRSRKLTGNSLLKLDQPATFAGLIGTDAFSLPLGSGIDLPGITANAIAFAFSTAGPTGPANGGPGLYTPPPAPTIQVLNAGAVVATLGTFGTFLGITGLSVTPDGTGGTMIKSDLATTSRLAFQIPGTHSQYTVSMMGHTMAISSATTTDYVFAGSQITFTDGTLFFNSNSQAATIYRLYEAAFGRAPDDTGSLYWGKLQNSGTSIVAIAAGFLHTPEYQGTGLTDTQFVAQLY